MMGLTQRNVLWELRINRCCSWVQVVKPGWNFWEERLIHLPPQKSCTIISASTWVSVPTCPVDNILTEVEWSGMLRIPQATVTLDVAGRWGCAAQTGSNSRGRVDGRGAHNHQRSAANRSSRCNLGETMVRVTDPMPLWQCCSSGNHKIRIQQSIHC